jgi:hypothetical protein
MNGIQLNNYGVVLEHFGINNLYVETLENALYHAQLSDYDRTQEDVNLILKNLTKYYLSIGEHRIANQYHAQIDTVGVDTESLATYYLSEGEILESKDKYVEAGISFTTSRNIASTGNHSTIATLAGKSLNRVNAKQVLHQERQRKNLIGGTILIVIGFIGWLFYKNIKRKILRRKVFEIISGD